MTVETLEEYGVVRMGDDEMRDFLRSHGTGILGLAGDGLPYLLPLSFGYDGDSALYFTFVVGESSRKNELTERAKEGRFLVFSTETAFSWRSVILSGTLESVPESEWKDLEAVMRNAWRPRLFEDAEEDLDVKVYRFRIRERSGLKHTGLPPDFQPRRLRKSAE